MSEDPHLTSRLVVEFVRGAQEGPKTSAAEAQQPRALQVGMCCKHFAGYDVEGGSSATHNDRYTFNATIGGRDLWETYLPAFKACTVEAGATHVMCSYNQLNGVPTCATPGLLTEILRTQWKWDGFVVSDYDGTISVTLCVSVCHDVCVCVCVWTVGECGWVNVWVWVVGREAVGLR